MFHFAKSPTVDECRIFNQEFGIDIVGEDNKTIVHHKVAARVVCVFTDQDAQAAARAEAQQNPSTYGALGQAPGGGGPPNSFPFSSPGGPGASNGVPGAQRRVTMQPQGLVGMGGLGGGARQPGKSGLTFDHILSRLQGELQKSRETGAELHSLTGAMNEIHETLGGSLVCADLTYIIVDRYAQATLFPSHQVTLLTLKPCLLLLLHKLLNLQTKAMQSLQHPDLLTRHPPWPSCNHNCVRLNCPLQVM